MSVLCIIHDLQVHPDKEQQEGISLFSCEECFKLQHFTFGKAGLQHSKEASGAEGHWNRPVMKEILGESLTSECLQSCLVCSLPCSGSVGMSEGRGCVLVTGCQARVPRDLRSSTHIKIALSKTKHNTNCRNLRQLLQFCCRINYLCPKNSRTVSNRQLLRKKC